MSGDSFFFSVGAPLCAGAFLSFLFERMLKTELLPWKDRPRTAVLVQSGLWVILFALELMLFQRPYVAAANVLALILVVILVSNAKQVALHEAFVVQDFEYFVDALKHPRFFLPYLGAWRGIVGVGGIIGALFAGLTLESPLTDRMSTGSFAGGVAILCLIGGLLLWMGTRLRPELTFRPEVDVSRLGLLASLWHYGVEERRPFPVVRNPVFASPPREGKCLPNIVVVLSESFFDARRLFPGIRDDVLHHFDRLKETSRCHGRLDVPAWGANTVRTEFAFLSGVANESLGIHRFNPYRYLARQGVPTLAGFLKKAGYRTVCMHPYPATYYSRDEIFPGLGFDEFIDLESLEEIEKVGPYAGDGALAERVCGLLDRHRRQSSQPVFVFVITMENHGPLHLEGIGPHDAARCYEAQPPAGCEDLTVYLRHMANEDRMIEVLRGYLESVEKDGWLCFFGDHMPSFRGVYEALGAPDARTDYVVWHRDGSSLSGELLDLKVEDVSPLLVREAGLLK